ncbi:MAG: hypothetical protein AAGC63_16350, partial [Propionicimonas sp.]|nr:hypothetical protein [Propionicimonas sp.]
MTGFASLGLDIGSTTVKAVVLDGATILHAAYRRHNADVRGELSTLLAEIAERFPGRRFRTAVTGSAGLTIAELLGADFV